MVRSDKEDQDVLFMAGQYSYRWKNIDWRILWLLWACDIMLNMLKVHMQQKRKKNVWASDLEVVFCLV